jgi:hypothetical protein
VTIDDSAVPDYTSMYRLDGRNFIVAGAGQGMGRQVAHSLSALGGQVYCVDIVGERAEDVAKEIGGQAHVADMRIGDQVRSVVEGAEAAFGRVHGVVDVIGVARWAALSEMPEEDWDWVHAEVVRGRWAPWPGRRRSPAPSPFCPATCLGISPANVSPLTVATSSSRPMALPNH